MAARRTRRSFGIHRARILRPLGRIGLVLLGALLGVQLWYFGWVLYYVGNDPGSTAFMELRRDAGATIEHEWVAYDGISHWLKRSVIAAEDATFMEHNGFDWSALHKALQQNLEADRVVRGGSTISQQLAKNLFLSPSQNLVRKAQEAAITIMLETTMSKRRILELYLNTIEWGDGVFGAAAAARHYYARHPARIDHWRASMLAARIPRPRYYDREGSTEYLIERAARIYEWANMVRIP